MDVQLELVGLDAGILCADALDDVGLQALEPGHMTLLEVAQRRDVAALDERHGIQACHCLAVPLSTSKSVLTPRQHRKTLTNPATV